jgi:hypothetical protein
MPNNYVLRQAIADRNGDNRASGLLGYDASAADVAGKLRGAGYNVTVQPFDFPFVEEFGSTFRQTAPTPTTSVAGETYDLLDFSGNVVMAGAHLDSEPDTAGINDNGSGSAALLEVVIKMAKLKTPNAVRFAWWGAEDDSAGEGAGPGPAGSAAIEQVFLKFFADRGEATALEATGYDLYGNLNTYAFDVNADAVATAVVTFAHDTSTVNGVAGAASGKVSAEAAGTGNLDVHGHARR